MVPQHGGDELPGWSRSVAPRRRHGHHAVCPIVGIVVEEPRVAPEQFLPLNKCGKACLDEPALGGNLRNVDQGGGGNEIELGLNNASLFCASEGA